MRIRIQVETETFIRFWLVLVGFLLAALMIYSARTGLMIVGSALFFALALNGPVTKIATILPGKSRIGSTAIAFLLVVVFLGAFIFLATPPIIQQTAKFAQTVPSLVETTTSSWESLNQIIDKYHLQNQVDEAMSSLKDNATSWASNVGGNILSGVGSVFGFLASLFLMLVISFLMLVEGPSWLQRLWSVYRDNEKMELHRKTITRMAGIVSGYVTGQLTVSAIGAFFAGVTVFIISLFAPEVPNNLAVATAALAFVFSLIPMFGSAISATLVALLLGLNSPVAAVIFVIYFIIYQQVENNFIGPAIQSRKLELSALIVLSAVTIGVYVFGIAGAIISIPIAGCVKILVEEYLENTKNKPKKTESTLHKLVKKAKD
ncbi:AI-2E family transporter [Candidatus Saccharibacteria bacterium]|nr:AI-2E family transporter [Candidatus Saccharibacteria bacterium]